MKRLVSLAILVMIPFLGKAQGFSNLVPGTFTYPVFTHTNYSSTSGDTTGYFSIKDISAISIVAGATDSVCQIFNIDGKNSVIDGNVGDTVLQTYQDSLVGVSNTLNVKTFYLRTSAGDRFGGCDLIRIRMIGSAKSTGNGTTSGRKVKVYFYISKQSKAL